mgnify:CR=1 FL=1
MDYVLVVVSIPQCQVRRTVRNVLPEERAGIVCGNSGIYSSTQGVIR